MGVLEAPGVSQRLKRENCKRTKHDSAFTDWKILIGPSDWEDHSLGKDGAARYRVHNLPNCCSCAGVYELGVTQSGHKTRKLDLNDIVPVYLGQAENVRTRLQQYGQTGSHLQNGNSTAEGRDGFQKGSGLFLEIFSRGFSIVFRWAPMKDKRNAEKTEAQLLDTFDYAWNKGSNGERRPADILQKLDRRISGKIRFPSIIGKLQIFRQRRVGIKIEGCEPLGEFPDQGSNNFMTQIFKFGKSRPRPVSFRYAVNENHDNICGVALGHGLVCCRPPVEGRKRCSEHKGMKVNGSISRLITEEGKSCATNDGVGFDVCSETKSDDHEAPHSSNYTINRCVSATCGVTLNDGSYCIKPPVHGRKRCEEHKGRRLNGPISESLIETCRAGRHVPNKECVTVCGVDLKDGTFCTRGPVVGRKRCEEHKGMRVKVTISKSLVADVPICV